MTEPSDLDLEAAPEGAPEPRRRGRWRWLLLAPLVVVAGVAVMAFTLDPAPLLARQATRSLGRPVTIAAARVDWSWSPALEVEDIRVANVPGGSVPDMYTVARLLIRIELKALLHGALRLREVEIDQPVLVLERDAQGVGNWKRLQPDGEAARTQRAVPVGSLTVRDGKLSYRGTSGSVQRIALETATLHDAANDAPTGLEADGSFNDVKLHVTATGDSFDVLRGGGPFGLDATVTSAASTLGFKGTIADLLEFEGIGGHATLDAKTPDDIAAMLGTILDLDLPIAIGGAFSETDGFWRLGDITGQLAGSAVSGTFSLAEGRRGQPDDIAADLDFPDLDLGPFVKAISFGASPGDAPMTVDANPPFTLALRLAAAQARLDGSKFSAVDLDASAIPGRLSIAALSLGAVGGKLSLSGTLEAVKAQTRTQVAGVASGMDVAQLVAIAGLPTGQVSGKFDAQVLLDMTGPTLQAALRAGRGTAVLSVLQGSISRDLVELASTDLRTLIRRGQGSTRLSCLLGVIDLRNGIANLAPFRLRTPEGTISGGGQYDLARDSIDGFVHSESASTGFFALDVPIQVSGSIRHVSVAPARRTTVRATEAQGAATVAALPAALKSLVNSQPCSR